MLFMGTFVCKPFKNVPFNSLKFTFTISQLFCRAKLMSPDGKHKHPKTACHSETRGERLPKLNTALEEFQQERKSSSEHINAGAIDLTDALEVVSCTQILCCPQNDTYFWIVLYSGNRTVNQGDRLHKPCHKVQRTLSGTPEACRCARLGKRAWGSTILLNKYLGVLQFFSISFDVSDNCDYKFYSRTDIFTLQWLLCCSKQRYIYNKSVQRENASHRTHACFIARMRNYVHGVLLQIYIYMVFISISLFQRDWEGWQGICQNT